MREGADYVALGPMFRTGTKEKARIAGPGYAAEAIRELPGDVPLVAIGGIGEGNLMELVGVGVRRVCVCSAVISQADPAERVRKICKMMHVSSVGST